jgi:hypothetical protein
MSRPGILVGALCGALVTAALIASLSLAYALAGLPFVPFQSFDRAARTLPGSVIRFAIDTMVAVIHGLLIGEASSVAKTAEQTMAIGGCLLVGTWPGARVSISWPEAYAGRAQESCSASCSACPPHGSRPASNNRPAPDR